MKTALTLRRDRAAMAASLLWTALALLGASVFAAQGPQQAPPTPAIPVSRDVDYPGMLTLRVDATDLDRHVFAVHESIPVQKAGKMTLLFPKWIPGGHTPRGSIDEVAGLVIKVDGRSIPWRRDDVEVCAFHVEVPEGAKQLELSFQFLSAVDPKIGRIVMTPVLLNLQWISMAFYPAGHYVSRIRIAPRVLLPKGWGYGCALEPERTEGDEVVFKPVSFERLMDSPIFAGRHYRQIDISPDGKVPVRLNLIADKAEHLEAKPEHIEKHRQLVVQAYRLFGSHHYDHYDFLVGLSDTLGRIGLEHHRSSENQVPPKYFTDWDKTFVGRDLLPHEFTHSWNGKFRRGADSWTPDYHAPMRNTLLWVYEGQTQYWGAVLAARSGLMTPQQVLEMLANVAASYDQRKGREWRNVLDTTHDPIIANRKPLSWRSFQRSEDYYSEGQLIWLDADTLIRERSAGTRSLDDFAQRFFGVDNGSDVPVTYTFEDVVRTLNQVAPADWTSFLKSRVEGLSDRAPMDGFVRGGYALVYTNAPTEFSKALETRQSATHFAFSLGFNVGTGGVLSEVFWGGPAFKAGLSQGSTLIAVNSESYEAEKLKDAIRDAAKSGAASIELLVKTGDRYRTVALDYHEGLRYPRLERIPGAASRLDEILAPRK